MYVVFFSDKSELHREKEMWESLWMSRDEECDFEIDGFVSRSTGR